METERNLVRRLEQGYSGALFDVLRGMGYPNQVLPPEIRALDPSLKIVGMVYTVSGHVDEAADPHQTLLGWTRMLSRVPAGSVVICQPNDSTLSHMGELSSETLMHRGIRGYIVDGGCRDSDFILRIGFPVFCRYLTPKDIVGRWVVDGLGDPIAIGGIAVATGDCVVADRDGVVIVPQSFAEAAVDGMEKIIRQEDLVRKAILGGMDPEQAYLEYGKF